MKNKIFVIGFNKTATSTFHQLFLANKKKSQHGGIWKTQNYDCFSDNPELPENNYKNLYKKYPDAKFILNTRSLNSWLLSRAVHCEALKQSWGYPLTDKLLTEWIDRRNEKHLEIINFFKDKPNKLIIVNIENDGWINFIKKEFNFKTDLTKKYNTAKKINKNKIDNFQKMIEKTFINKKIPKEYYEDKFLDFSISKDSNIQNLINLYKNNL